MEARQEVVDCGASGASPVVLKLDDIYTAVGVLLGSFESKSEFKLKAWLECFVDWLYGTASFIYNNRLI